MDEEKFNPWQWAFKALKKYRSALGWENKDLPPDKIVAVLIGQAQEGKTSLAMRLLGASKEEAKRLKPALRGGREYGKSATQVATIYKAVGTDMTEEYLRKIERKIKRAWEELPEELYLELPLKGYVAAQVVDLVGLNPRDKVEKERAKKMAKKWLSLADLLIYVCGADHISNLTPHELEMQQIMNRWKINKDTAVIVLTRAYEVLPPEEEKIRDNIQEPEELFHRFQDIYKKHIIAQMKQTEQDMSEDDLPLVVPVYLKTDDTDPKLEKTTEYALKIIKDTVDKNPIRYRVRAGFTYPRQILHKIINERKAHEKKQEEKEKEKQEWEKRIKSFEEKIEKQKKKIKDLEKELKNTRKKQYGLQNAHWDFLNLFYSQINGLSIPWEEGKIGEKIQQIERIGQEFNERIIEGFKTAKKEFIKKLPKDIRNNVSLNEAFRKSLRELNAFLNRQHLQIRNRCIVHGWFWGVKWKESWTNLIRWARYTLQESMQRVRQSIRRYLKPVLDKETRRIRKQEIIQKESEIQYKKRRINELIREKESKEREFKKWEEEYKKELLKLEKEIKKDKIKLKKAKEYQQYITTEFLNFWNNEVRKINKEEDPIKILNAVARLNEASEVLEELATYKEKEGMS